jgi:hypothetical protein
MQDRFESKGISVVYCPTDEMLADYFTKPLQGSFGNSGPFFSVIVM